MLFALLRDNDAGDATLDDDNDVGGVMMTFVGSESSWQRSWSGDHRRQFAGFLHFPSRQCGKSVRLQRSSG